MKKIMSLVITLIFIITPSCKKDKTMDIQIILENFMQLTKIPRCSKNEAAVSNWLQDWAKKNGFKYHLEKTNTLIIYVPATQGLENVPAVVLQAHIDMVCQKTDDSKINFETDPIEAYIEGDYLRAKKTTLGADDGIGVAMAMTLALDKTIKRPALELLFTTDEEIDMTGASQLSTDVLKGKYCINIDSEEEGVVTIGSAGGVQMWTELLLEKEKIPADSKVLTVKLEGLIGGHSGLEIIKGGANANVLLAESLTKIFEKLAVEKKDIRLISFNGGTASNAITKSASAEIIVSQNDISVVNDLFQANLKDLQKKYSSVEKSISCNIIENKNPYAESFTVNDSLKAVRFISGLPYGVIAMSEEMKGLVETSANVGIVETKDNVIGIRTYHRSSINSKLDSITNIIKNLVSDAGAKTKIMSSFPAWQPDPKSKLLEQSLKVYKATFSRDLKVDVIHAGLECSMIANKYPDMQLISVGPTLKDVHTPEEHLYLPTVGKVYILIAEILKSEELH